MNLLPGPPMPWGPHDGAHGPLVRFEGPLFEKALGSAQMYSHALGSAPIFKASYVETCVDRSFWPRRNPKSVCDAIRPFGWSVQYIPPMQIHYHSMRCTRVFSNTCVDSVEGRVDAVPPTPVCTFFTNKFLFSKVHGILYSRFPQGR